MRAQRKPRAARVWVILARVSEERRVARPGRLGFQTEVVRVPHAMVWKRNASPDKDFKAAQEWAHSNQDGGAWTVLMFPASERDPLLAGRRAIIGATP